MWSVSEDSVVAVAVAVAAAAAQFEHTYICQDGVATNRACLTDWRGPLSNLAGGCRGGQLVGYGGYPACVHASISSISASSSSSSCFCSFSHSPNPSHLPHSAGIDTQGPYTSEC